MTNTRKTTSSLGPTAIVWTCAHDRPEVSKDRYKWLGSLIEDIKPDYCIDLGDGTEMASLNSFDTRYPQAIVSQNYEADVESYNESQDILWSRFKKSKKKRPYRIGFEGNHCLPKDTDVLTAKYGWVNITEVEAGDTVMSLSGWTNVEETHEVYYDGPMYEYGDRSVKARMTEGHRVYYYKSNGGLGVKLAKDAPWVLDLPVATVTGKGIPYTDAQIKFNAVAMTDSYHGRNGKVVFYQSGPKAQVIRDIMSDAGVDYKEVKRERDTTHICGVELKSVQTSYEFHMDKPVWSVGSNKEIPDYFYGMSEGQFEVLLDTLVFCDGSIPTGATTSRVFYGRKLICEQLQALCVTKGYRATLSEYRENHWRVNICKTLKCRASKSVISDNWDDMVYCLTTSTGNFLMRQDNKPSFTGNCHRITRAIKHDPRLEGNKHGISMKHLNHDHWFDDYHNYENGGPAIREYDGVAYAHFFSSGNMGSAMSGLHHGYGLVNLKGMSATCGHSHKRSMFFKDGAGSGGKGMIGAVAGCYKGAKESWAGQQADWAYGVLIKRNICGGMYDPQWVSMAALEAEYG